MNDPNKKVISSTYLKTGANQRKQQCVKRTKLSERETKSNIRFSRKPRNASKEMTLEEKKQKKKSQHSSEFTKKKVRFFRENVKRSESRMRRRKIWEAFLYLWRRTSASLSLSGIGRDSLSLSNEGEGTRTAATLCHTTMGLLCFFSW